MAKKTTSWRPAVSKAAGPLYLAIADALAADMKAGRLPPGTRLPPQRALAEALDIDFTTVSRAYAEARKRGLVEGRVGQGTYVRGRAVSAPPPSSGGLIDMSMNMPPRPADPDLGRRLWEGIASLEASGLDLLLRYQEPGGARLDRLAGSDWLEGRLGRLPPERVLVCPGAQGALLAVLGALVKPGAVVCAEALTYPGFLSLAAHLRLQLAPVAMDAGGLIPDAFEEACRRHAPKALYCTPTLHNPTTATLSLERRHALVEIARAHGVAIIEDDAYGALPRSPVPPLAALAPDLVYHVAGLAKCLSPALRIAYLVVPDARAAARMVGVIRATTSMASPLTAAIATRVIADGTAQAVREAIRAEATARQEMAAAILPEGHVRADREGFHVWLSLPPPWPRGEFIGRLRMAGIGAVPSDAFALGPGPAPEAVRLGLGVAATREDLAVGLRIVADLMDQSPALSALIV